MADLLVYAGSALVIAWGVAVITGAYPLSQVPDAIGLWEQGHARGNTAITI
jgi:hypothetical protein